MKTKSAICQKLELISQPALKHKFNQQKLRSWLFHICKSLAKALIGKNEPRIWQKTNRQGDTYWKVYDPATGQTAYFTCEAEVRIWLEQCYYRLFN